MKIALGMITKDERPILEKTLTYKALWFQHKFAVDFYSGDYTVEILGAFGVHVHSQVWKNNFALARNALIQIAEEAGMDYLFMLDADEAMNQDAINLCIKYAQEGHDVIALPRIEFVQDFQHYDPTLYPDFQCRFFRLNKGYYFKNKIHEMLHDPVDGRPVLETPSKFTVIPTAHIFHYSRLKDHKALTLKYVNYDRLSKGLEPIEALPQGYDPHSKFWSKCIPYLQDHPLKNI